MCMSFVVCRTMSVVEYKGLRVDLSNGQLFRKVGKEWIEKKSTDQGNGYMVTKLPKSRKNVFVHRFVYSAFLGRDLEKDEIINHKDFNPSNNALENLVLGTHSQNSQWMRDNPRNSSGAKGVYWHSKLKKWQAYISIDRKMTTIGWYETFEEAKNARIAKVFELNSIIENGKQKYTYYVEQ